MIKCVEIFIIIWIQLRVGSNENNIEKHYEIEVEKTLIIFEILNLCHITYWKIYPSLTVYYTCTITKS